MGIDSHPFNAPGGPDRDQSDFARLRHARDRHAGFRIGQYLQPPPMLFTRDGHNVFLGDMYRGHAAFLICAGPSLTSHDLTKLDQRGILTLAVNNAAAVYRPRLWCSVDDPSHFVDAIWKDPGITKFVPLCHMEKPIHVRDAENRLVPGDERVGDMPAVFGFRRNEAFVADQWLFEDTFNWGNHSDRTDESGNKGSRSVMYIALRLLFYLGVRRVFLVGCDFKMQTEKPNYAFEQDRTAASVRSNNQTYQILNRRLERLLPHFKANDFHVCNCTPDSGLAVFPHVPFDEAVEAGRAHMPREIVTAGMYDGAARRKEPTVSGSPKKEPSAASIEPSIPDGLPPVTLVVPLGGADVNVFPQTWETWLAFHPWLGSLPLVLVCDADANVDRALADSLPPETRVIAVERPSADNGKHTRLGELTGPMLDVVARFAQTEWFLKLDADVVAAAHDRPWPDPQWFRQMEAANPPVLIAHRWGSIRTGTVIDELDDWSAQVPELAKGPPFCGQSPRLDDRIKTETISTWCVLGRTDWTRTLAEWFRAGALDAPYATFLHYCSWRARKSVLPVDMKSHGWDHSFSRDANRIRRLCASALRRRRETTGLRRAAPRREEVGPACAK